VLGVRDRLLDRPLAAKRLRAADREEQTRAFLAEARVMGALAHPAIIPIHDFGVPPGASPWILMDRIAGEDLKQRIDERGPVRAHDGSMTAVLDALSRACDALSLAHDHGYLHRDLKPANIMLGAYGAVFVVDWGLALPRERWPWPGDAMGTPAYMAPEQARRAALDARTDVWGIGACLYCALTGRAPHPGDRDTAFARAADGAPVPPVAEVRRGDPAPPALIRLAEACLSADPADRPGSMDRLRAELDRARHGSWRLPRRTVSAGDVIVREGEPGDTAWLIVSGRFQVVRSGRGVLRELGPGEVFGELSPSSGRRAAPRCAP
jgi:serine/threonine-protein kinase